MFFFNVRPSAVVMRRLWDVQSFWWKRLHVRLWKIAGWKSKWFIHWTTDV